MSKTSRCIDRLLNEQGFKCFYCQRPIARPRVANKRSGVRKATVDHVIPASKGGANKMENYVAACASCNVAKDTKSIEEFLKWRRAE